jgi:predicted nucleic acid-binding Zn ribbon protein
MARKRREEAIGNLIPSVLSDLGLDDSALSVRLIRIWDEALGPAVATHCRPDGVRGDVLYATVPDSAWMQRLQLQKPTILRRLTEALGEPPAADLRLRVRA